MEKRLLRKENIALTHSTLAAKAMRELNWKPEQSAELTVLGDTECGSGGHPARILEFSGKQLRLATSVAPKSGVAVSLEWDGQLLLGQVLNSEPAYAAGHRRVELAKTGLAALGRPARCRLKRSGCIA